MVKNKQELWIVHLQNTYRLTETVKSNVKPKSQSYMGIHVPGFIGICGISLLHVF